MISRWKPSVRQTVYEFLQLLFQRRRRAASAGRQTVYEFLRLLVLGSFVVGTLAWAGEFWNDKKPAEWSEKEVQQLLAKSPWAKEVSAEFDRSAMQGGMGRPGGGMGGPSGGVGSGGMGGGMPFPGGTGGTFPGGGGMGGPGMGGPPGGMGGAPPQFKATVRWETALPVREAMSLRNQMPADASEYYVIRVSGLPSMGGRAGSRGGNAPSPEERQSQLQASTQLQRKGKDPLRPERVEIFEDDGSLLFFFSRNSQPIQSEDKEVTFLTQLGPLKLESKFQLKDMVYQGQLEL